MGTYKSKERRGNTLLTYMNNDYENDPVGLLAATIVIQAVVDWRELVKRKAWRDKDPSRYCNFEELRKFFKSEWCAFLLLKFEVDPERILEILEAELASAMRKGANKNGHNERISCRRKKGS